MPEAVFFDAAGTLFTAKQPVGHIYARIARKHGLDACDGQVSARFRRVFSSTHGLAFGPGRASAELRRLERLWWARLVWASFKGLGEFDDFDAFFEELFGYFAEPAHWRLTPEALDARCIACLCHHGYATTAGSLTSSYRMLLAGFRSPVREAPQGLCPP